MKNPFAPLPKDLQCTEIYGGPEQAVITGTHKGQRIWVQLAAAERLRDRALEEAGVSHRGAAPGSGGS